MPNPNPPPWTGTLVLKGEPVGRACYRIRDIRVRRFCRECRSEQESARLQVNARLPLAVLCDACFRAKNERLALSTWAKNWIYHKRRADKRGWANVNLDAAYLMALWEQQQGRCALSGLRMEFHGTRHPALISVDRIDNARGYEKGNVQLVCLLANSMKSSLTMQEFGDWCRRIATHMESTTYVT